MCLYEYNLCLHVFVYLSVFLCINRAENKQIRIAICESILSQMRITSTKGFTMPANLLRLFCESFVLTVFTIRLTIFRCAAACRLFNSFI